MYTCGIQKSWAMPVVKGHQGYGIVSAHTRKLLCTLTQYNTFVHVTKHTILNWLLSRLETAQSSHLNRTSDLRASYLFVKLESYVVVQAFVTVSYRCLSCSTAAKRLLAFQWLQGTKNAPCGPAPLWKLLYIIGFDFYLAINWTKTDVRFYQVDLHVEVDGWRVPLSFYIVAMPFK